MGPSIKIGYFNNYWPICVLPVQYAHGPTWDGPYSIGYCPTGLTVRYGYKLLQYVKAVAVLEDVEGEESKLLDGWDAIKM
jgi:hypothetical protein